MEDMRQRVYLYTCRYQFLVLYVWVFAVITFHLQYPMEGVLVFGILGPVFYYIQAKEKASPLVYLKLSSACWQKGIVYGMGASALFAAILLTKVWLFGTGMLVLSWPWRELAERVVVASCLEEIFFRGFLLRKFLKILSFYKANGIVTILFILLHVPVWCMDEIGWLGFLYHAAYVGAISWLLGYMRQQAQSLWAPLCFHACNNYLTLLTIGIVY